MRFWIAFGLGLAVSSAAPAAADDRAALLAVLHVDRVSTYRVTVVDKHGRETIVQYLTVLDPEHEADYLPQMHQTDVYIGGRVWIRKDNGTWSGSTALPAHMVAAFRVVKRDPVAWVKRVLTRSTVTALGVGVLGGVKVAHFRVLRSGRISHRVTTYDVWVDVTDGLPRREITTFPGGDTISGTFSAFGQRLSIPTPP